MPAYVTPGVYFETVDVSRRSITAIRTDVAAFVGIAERGPLHAPTRVNSWEQFQSVFGSFIPNGYLAYTAKAFFENGGQTCYIVRIAATPTTYADAFPISDTATVVLAVAGFNAGDVVVVRQDKSPTVSIQRDHLLQAVDTANRKLVWAQPLEADFILNDPARPLRFESGAMPARGVLLDDAGQPTLFVEASSAGSWGNSLLVRVARTSQFSTRTSTAPQPSDRTGSKVDALVGFMPGTLVKVYQEGLPALESYHVVERVDAAKSLVVWAQKLDVLYDLARPIHFETLEFSLTVYLDGHPREHFSGLSLVKPGATGDDETKRLYVEDAINGPRLSDESKKKKFEASTLIRVRNLESPSPFPASLPNPEAANLSRGQLRLQNGRDGISILTPEDFTGQVWAEERRGLRMLEDVDEVSIVAVPDILIQPPPPVVVAPQPKPEPDVCLPNQSPPEAEPPPPKTFEQVPAFTLEDVFAVQQALIAHCERQRDRIALLDPPVTTREWVVMENPLVVSQETMVMELGEMQSWRQRFDSKYAAMYYPWVLVSDALRLGNQVVRALPPSGHVAGIFARTDAETGVHKAPANAGVDWAQGVSVEVSPVEQGVLNPIGINVMRTFAGRGIRLYGARTISSDTSWRYVNVRRLLMMIEEAVDQSIQWTVFEPNDFKLRRTLILAISSFLEALWQRGALVGETVEEAFFVKCDAENNPPDIVELGQIIVDVGVAPAIPAEFVVFRIGKTVDEMQVTE